MKEILFSSGENDEKNIFYYDMYARHDVIIDISLCVAGKCKFNSIHQGSQAVISGRGPSMESNSISSICTPCRASLGLD